MPQFPQAKKPQSGYVPPIQPMTPRVVQQTPNMGIPASSVGKPATPNMTNGVVPPMPNNSPRTPQMNALNSGSVGNGYVNEGVAPKYPTANPDGAIGRATSAVANMVGGGSVGTQQAYTVPAMPVIPNQYQSPVNLYPQLTPDQIAEEQRAKAAALIQQRTTAANQAKAGINTSFDRLKTNIGQDRALENNYNDRQLSPFSGRSDFAQGMIAMERGRSDREAQQDLQTRLANIDVSLEDFTNATEDQRQAMINEAIRQERDYGLQVDNQQFGQWANQRDFGYNAGQDQIQNDAQYGGVYNGQQTAAQQQQAWQNRFNYGQATGTFGNGQKTAEKAQQDWSNAFQQGQFNFEKAQTVWEQAFQGRKFEQDMKDAAASRGLQWAGLNQRDKEFIADQEFREKSFTLDQEKFDFTKSQSGSQLSDKDSTDNYNEAVGNIESGGLDKTKAKSYIQDPRVRDSLSDSDYKAALKWIEDNL